MISRSCSTLFEMPRAHTRLEPIGSNLASLLHLINMVGSQRMSYITKPHLIYLELIIQLTSEGISGCGFFIAWK
jgi:hypothetical protein